MVTNSAYGGYWAYENNEGVTRREMNNTPTDAFSYVASSNMKNSHSYTDFHDVDEDKATIPSLGEHWRGQVYAGLHCRHIDWLPSTLGNMVASKKK